MGITGKKRTIVVRMSWTPKTFLPVEVVFGPSWWHKRHGLRFDRGFFYDPVRRVRDEQRMRRILADTFGDLGLGEKNAAPRPVIGAVHLAAGYLIAEIMGCEVVFHEDAPPDVISPRLTDQAFETWNPPVWSETPAGRDFRRMAETLRKQFGYVEGDANWSGVQNAALDLRGQELFLDYYSRPQAVARFIPAVAEVLLEFVRYVDSVSNSSSISVNRSVGLVDERLHLTSNCTVSMISAEFYERFLLEADRTLARNLQPFGIHHCGANLHRLAPSYARVGEVSFFDVGWGSDVAACRKVLPDAFFNLRLSPVKLVRCTPDDVISDVRRLARESGRPDRTGFCCTNMDDQVPDENVRALYHAVAELRQHGNL
jgi:hypothetical protein